MNSINFPVIQKALLALTLSTATPMIYADNNQSTISNAPLTQEANTTQSKHWLLDSPTNQQKFQRFEKYLRGFDQPMLEVGQRFQHIKQAITDNNYLLADYHWKKIKLTIENGLMKRPARASNAQNILLNQTWQQVADGFKSKDKQQAKIALEQARNACIACHQAENVSFINNQPLFNITD